MRIGCGISGTGKSVAVGEERRSERSIGRMVGVGVEVVACFGTIIRIGVGVGAIYVVGVGVLMRIGGVYGVGVGVLVGILVGVGVQKIVPGLGSQYNFVPVFGSTTP